MTKTEQRDVIFLARVYSLVARMHSVVTGVEGMKATNAERVSCGYGIAYDEAGFAHDADILEKISNELDALSSNLGENQ